MRVRTRIEWPVSTDIISPDTVITATNYQTNERVSGPAKKVLGYVLRWIVDEERVMIELGSF